MLLRSLKGCQLVIGSYPPFAYNATGGGGNATVLSDKDNIVSLKFASDTFSIPPLTSQTTKFLSFPLPPGLKIEMYMDKLEGTINKNSGEVVLIFESRFIFSIGSRFFFPNLIVKTSLKTGEVKSKLHQEKGLILQKDGKATLVGVAVIPVTTNKLLNFFLRLPNEALAVLKCEIKAQETTYQTK